MAPNDVAFAAWAEVYDQQDNPLLALEERFLPRVLPEIRGRDIADIGCGTGRWLGVFARLGAASVCGLDSSQEMLDVAARKQLAGVRLLRADLPQIPLQSDAFDLVLASFVFSYVADLRDCAAELARVIRPGGDLFISDVHPDTAAQLGWSRAFRSHGQTFRLAGHNRAIAEVAETFASAGFSVAACLEPHLAGPERDLFVKHGKGAAWEQVDGLPPIYALHLKRLSFSSETKHTLALRGGHLAVGPHEVLSASLFADGEVISSVLSEAASPAVPVASELVNLDLRGFLLLPGLVNAHDHLEFALFPRLGSGPYKNATEWAADIQVNQAETIALHKSVPKDVRLWWGGVRNLLCGVTTVCHHNPLHSILRGKDFPVRVLQEFGWEHSLAFARDLPAALARTGSDNPFVIHAAEGVDDRADLELAALETVGALDIRSVLVHGLALDRKGVRRLNDCGASLVICPSSNQFLFEQTHTATLLQSVRRLALGSDSPLTAEGDLLDELRFARRACELSPERLYGMVTDHAAEVLRLRHGEGRLRAGAVFDLFAIRQRPEPPADLLIGLSWRDVEMVVVGGQVHLASGEMYRHLPPAIARGLTAINIEGHVRWLAGPVNEFLDSAEKVLGVGKVRVGGLQVSKVAD